MRALVVIESLWGGTEAVAHTVAKGLACTMSVDVLDSDSAPVAGGYDLVVVGSPTHAFGMSREEMREEVTRTRGLSWAPQRGIHEWLAALPSPSGQVSAVAFDTRADGPRRPGSKARVARRELRALGFEVSGGAETFRVREYEGPLVDGELDRATAWARELSGRLVASKLAV